MIAFQGVWREYFWGEPGMVHGVCLGCYLGADHYHDDEQWAFGLDDFIWLNLGLIYMMLGFCIYDDTTVNWASLFNAISSSTLVNKQASNEPFHNRDSPSTRL